MSSAPAKKPAAKNPAAKPARTAANKAAPIKPVAVAKPAEAADAGAANTMMRTRDLIARVAESTGGKVKDIKATVESVLAELGKALDAGEMLNIPPLGKIKLAGAKAGEAAGPDAKGPVKLKLHRAAPASGDKKPGKQALADDSEDS